MEKVKSALAHKIKKHMPQGLSYTLTAANHAGTIWTLNVPAFRVRNLVLRNLEKDAACTTAERLIEEAGSSEKPFYKTGCNNAAEEIRSLPDGTLALAAAR